ncbi:hypothetical protein PCANC_04923 [Puccinia coronata f. sp. avenae]|uniref:Uncharacterized protein n=1 Tax=Puccinia coronata f. sp. avenae TaxID=200324 RepID=A0A2N5VWJ4_9BASI|nr:hypothetical protein PCANC_04923 [Puccinia coronata f. sp. avenae]
MLSRRLRIYLKEATSASLPPPPPLDKEEEEGKERKESLEVITETALKALSSSQLDATVFLQAAWKAYKKAQNDEEWDLLPRYIQTVIAQFCLVRSYLSWNKATDKIGGINPYTKQKVAKSWAEMKGQVPPPKKNLEGTSAKEAFCGYKIPKTAQGKEKITEGISLTKKGPLKRTRRFEENQGQQAGPSKKKKENKLSLEKRKWKRVTKLAQALLEVKEATT